MTIRFAFYGRVSTEDNQDPEASRAWQLARARALIEPHGGVIVAEFFDIDASRSIPWSRRPYASALLDQIKYPRRAFDAVVISEPHRAFYGNQYSLTFPVFEHFRVPLWVPEVGGAIDPANEAHDMIMGVFGGLSKGERNRIKIRVKAAMEAITVTEGRFLGGRPPYGYLLVDAGPHPNPAKAADGKRLKRLDVDPVAAPIVTRIFAEYIQGMGYLAIAEGLTRDGIPCPSAHDRKRNRHRDGRAWSKGAVRTILKNGRYTGRQVWNKQRKVELLIDVDDVALGHITRLRWNSPDKWVYSQRIVHPPLISQENFLQVQEIFAERKRSQKGGCKTRKADHEYALRGRMFCALCNRKMQANIRDACTYYRCRYPDQYGLANKVHHPRNVYVREDHVVAGLDKWIAQALTPHRLKETINDLYTSQQDDTAAYAITHAEAKIAECATKLERHRTALEAGTDPAIIAQWIAQTQNEQHVARQQLDLARQAQPDHMSEEEIADLIQAAGDIRELLRTADTGDKNALYRNLGVRLVYHPENRTVRAEMTLNTDLMCHEIANRGSTSSVRGGT